MGVHTQLRLLACGIALHILWAGALVPLAAQEEGAEARVAPETLKPGTHELKLTAAGHVWTYHLYLPPQAAERKALPLVLLLHGAGGNGNLYLEKNDWPKLANAEGFAVLAPDGQPARPEADATFRTNPRLWNDGRTRMPDARVKIDDIAFFKALLDDAAARVPVDARRVYATGHSNGAGMTFRLGAELSSRFAALAPVSGRLSLAEPKPERALPTLYIMGTKDPLNPVEGGERSLPWSIKKEKLAPVGEMLTQWAAALGCAKPSEPKTVSDKDGLKVVEYGPGRDGAPFTAVYIEGQGHGWPGGREAGLPENVIGPSVETYNATEKIWAFFKQYPKEK